MGHNKGKDDKKTRAKRRKKNDPPRGGKAEGNRVKYLPTIAGLLLGALFLMSSVVVLFHLVPMPAIPEGTPPWHFMQAFGPTGYMTFIKVLELTGAILVAIPRTRNFGLLILGPIIVNILAYHTFDMHGVGLENPMIIGIVLLALYLLWAGRRQFAGLANGRAPLV